MRHYTGCRYRYYGQMSLSQHTSKTNKRNMNTKTDLPLGYTYFTYVCRRAIATSRWYGVVFGSDDVTTRGLHRTIRWRDDGNRVNGGAEASAADEQRPGDAVRVGNVAHARYVYAVWVKRRKTIKNKKRLPRPVVRYTGGATTWNSVTVGS